MMTAMARLPCKSTTSSTQQQSRQSSGFGNGGRTYWDMQRQQPAPPAYVRTQHRQAIDHGGKRKSAVELLQESKAFYVKSEIVLDRKQELKNSGHLQVAPSTAPAAPGFRLLRKCGSPSTCNVPQATSQLPLVAAGTCCWANCQDRPDGVLSPQWVHPPALPPKSPRLVSVPQRRAISGPPSGTGSDQLQTKLRRLLNTDSKENVFFSDYSPTNGVNRDDKVRFSAASTSGCCDDKEDVRVSRHCNTSDIRFKFGRSNSHSHSSAKTSRKLSASPPIDTTTCHKSLPDLHTTAKRRSSLSPRASIKSSAKVSASGHPHSSGNCPDCETSSDYSEHSFRRDANSYRSSRHIRRSLGSGGGDASSVLSSGGRTQKSSGSSKLSHGATARDSGGSSGHCTHRSEPPPRIQDCWSHVRRDSGASTQHSTDKDRSRKGSYVSGGTPPSIVQNFSAESDESANSPTDCSPTCNSRLSEGWKEGRGRPILRSKSDISDRYWRQENGRKKTSPRPPRSVMELENFFDKLGLDNEKYEMLTVARSNSSSPVFFDSVSSVDSALGLHPWPGNNTQPSSGNGQQWQGNNCSVGKDETSQRVSDPPSIVERNARIIKWLCQCRKVQFGYS